MRVIVAFGAAIMAATFSAAQEDRARPRDRDPEREHPQHVAPAQPAPAPEPPPAPVSPSAVQRDRAETRDRAEAEERRTRPRGERFDPDRAYPRQPQPAPPQGSPSPRGPDGLTEAERRHPRPDPDRHFNDGRFRYQDYPDFSWWYGPSDYYWFPYRYDYGPRVFRWRFYGYPFGPHARLWHPEYEVWFYWPFDNEPRLGCHRYWVPTARLVKRYGFFRQQRRYGYTHWRIIELCVEGREYPR